MKYAVNILLLFTLFQSSAQNLVPNPSFEDYSGCPDQTGLLDNLDFWFNPTTGSSDYFNSCYTTGPINVDVPTNYFGYQNPVSGNGYIGLFLFYPITNYREYAEVELNDTLSAGSTYYITMHLSLTDSSNYATDELGIYFSSDSITYGSYTNLSVTPQVQNNAGNYLSDKDNWMLFTSQFTASGGEKFITIGNFKTDVNTDYINVPGGGNIAGDYFGYYLIDDICISPDSVTCIEALGVTELSNPKKKLIRILDTMGRETDDRPNTLLIYVYSDGTTEKVYRVK